MVVMNDNDALPGRVYIYLGVTNVYMHNILR